jgi:hypothetical protein
VAGDGVAGCAESDASSMKAVKGPLDIIMTAGRTLVAPAGERRSPVFIGR